MINIREIRRTQAEAADPSGFRDQDVRLLTRLADDQLRFGQAEEALVLLQVCQKMRPQDPDIVLRLARTFASLEEWDAADAMLTAYDRMRGGGMWRSADTLLRAVVSQARHRVDDARRIFAGYVTRLQEETP